MQYNYFATCILHRELYNHRILGPIHIRSYIIYTYGLQVKMALFWQYHSVVTHKRFVCCALIIRIY